MSRRCTAKHLAARVSRWEHAHGVVRTAPKVCERVSSRSGALTLAQLRKWVKNDPMNRRVQ